MVFNYQFSIKKLMAKSPKLIQLYKLPTISHCFEVAHKLLIRDNHRTSAVVGVKTQTLGIFEIFVEEEMRVILLIVN